MTEELVDKYIATELILGVGLGNERCGRVTKSKGKKVCTEKISGAPTLTPYLT
jgi:hypothetical protein